MFLVPAAARADWQWTTWRMTEDQVKAASKGAAIPISAESRTTLAFTLSTPYSAAGVNYVARFGFTRDTGELMAVNLQVPDSSCSVVHSKLIETYGEATIVSSIPGVMSEVNWHDKERGNVVALTEVKGACSLLYTPLDNIRASGL